MRRVVTALFAVALLAGTAATSSATQWPPGNGTCTKTDTLVYVKYIQNPGLLPCFTATGDTVNGIGGIITGIDAIPTGFSFYIQNNSRTGASQDPWTGADIFTGGSNFVSSMGLALGDSVMTYGVTAEFQGGTELLSYNNSFSTPNIVIRKISSGNALPLFHVGTTAELKEPTANPNAEQWEGCLVQIPGPLRVARTSFTGGMAYNTFKIVDNNVCPPGSLGPCDSVTVDGGTLTSFAPPNVGVLIDNVQGIYDQRNLGASGNALYRIMLRNGNDIQTATPPNVADAYPVANDTVRVVFDRNVTQASAEDPSNYSLGSFGVIGGAVLVEPNAAHVKITNGLNPGDNESITVNNIVGAANGLAMTTGQTLDFYNGVLSIAQIQAPDPAYLSGVCEDRSRFAGTGSSIGQVLTYRGICTAQYGNLFYMTDRPAVDKPQARSGVVLFAPVANPIVGHQYLVTASIQEYYEETEASANVYLRDEGPGVTIYPQHVKEWINVHDLADSTCDATQTLNTGEDWEGVLVRLQGVKIVNSASAGEGFRVCTAPSGPDTIPVTMSSAIPFTFVADSLHWIDVTGILRWYFGYFRIAPRSDADIIDYGPVTGVPSHGAPELSFAVSPNPARTPTLRFSLPRAENVELGVYDVSGRLVRTVLRANLPAGSYSKVWDGTDGHGGATGSGVFFYRMKFGNQVLTQRGVRIN